MLVDETRFKRRCLKSVLLNKQKLRTEAMKRCPKPCFAISVVRENRFNGLTVSCTIGNLAFKTFETLEKDDSAKFLAEQGTRCSIIIKHRISCSAGK